MGGPEHFESLWPNVLAHNESGKSVLEDEYNIERALGFMHQVDKVFYSETSVRNNVAPGYFEGNKNYVILQHPNAIMADLGFGRKEPMKAFVLLRGKHLDTALDVHAHPILEAYFYQKLGEALAELARNGQIKSSRGSAKKIIPVEEQRGFHARGSLTAVQTAYLSDKGYKVPDSHPFRVFGGSWYNVKFSEEYVKRLKKLKEMGHIRVNDDLLFDEYVGHMKKVIKAMKWGLKP
ncbi:MAG: hypothetical protein GXN93_00170 [Candidatus Diapherotrites archaeon]|nr:hypothetical protein [Candidatus Diapherotrites archaeon]